MLVNLYYVECQRRDKHCEGPRIKFGNGEDRLITSSAEECGRLCGHIHEKNIPGVSKCERWAYWGKAKGCYMYQINDCDYIEDYDDDDNNVAGDWMCPGVEGKFNPYPCRSRPWHHQIICKRVFPSLVYFQTIHIFLDCTLARVGPSPSDSTATITIEDNFKCPTEIDRSQPQENREDKFSVVQTGSSLTITQIGSGLSNWDLNLQFLCCGGKDTFQSFNF